MTSGSSSSSSNYRPVDLIIPCFSFIGMVLGILVIFAGAYRYDTEDTRDLMAYLLMFGGILLLIVYSFLCAASIVWLEIRDNDNAIANADAYAKGSGSV